jgi:rare lipoprotein A
MANEIRMTMRDSVLLRPPHFLSHRTIVTFRRITGLGTSPGVGEAKQQLKKKGSSMAIKSRTMIVLSCVFFALSPTIASAQSGIASIYSGGKTANGERALAGRLTAAHRSLPFGTMVKVTHKRTGKSVVVRINDRGPFIRGRVIDLTPAGARALGFNGLAPVALSIVRGG